MDKFVGVNRSVDDFRRWVLSDWESPTTRALLAEYYVRCATGADSEPAGEWEYVDIILKDDTTIEVKCTAYLQPAGGAGLKRTNPGFDIEKKKYAWNTKSWQWEAESSAPRRRADCYVLCLENMKEPEAYNPLNLTQWEFFVVSKSRIDEMFGDQKTVTVGRLKQEGICSVSFDDLACAISRNIRS